MISNIPARGLLAAVLFLTSFLIRAQDLTQTVTGTVTNELGSPLKGVSIRMSGPRDLAITTNEKGYFSTVVPVGRYQLAISHIGYENLNEELLVIAAKQVVINRVLSPSQRVLEAVEVSSGIEVDVPGLQSIPIEKTLRVPANFFDPVRMITTYPGVIAANDQNNSVVIRGNSPNGLLWRLNGLDIVNPNHLANAGTFSDRPAAAGGGVNILSAQMLDRTDFYMGMVPSQFGNTLSGVIDMNLREGNKNDFEYTAQASLIGLDFAAEGPIGNNNANSFLVNYRYSTVGLLSAAGVDFGGEAITFQDLSLHTIFTRPNGGNISLFGFWGDSKNRFTSKDSVDTAEDKDFFNIDYDALTYAAGLNYTLPVLNGKFMAGVAYSSTDQSRSSSPSFITFPRNERRLLNDDFQSKDALLSTSIRYLNKVGSNGTIEVGAMGNFIEREFETESDFGCLICGSRTVETLRGDISGLLAQPFVEYKNALSSKMRLDAGLRYVYFTYNASSSIEPRVLLSFMPTTNSSFDVSYALISQQQLTQVYVSPGNKDLGFTKSHHGDIRYKFQFSEGVKVNAGLFYQYLFDVPVENDSSAFSVLNLIEAIPDSHLVNDGTGKNYGVDITLEKQFFGNSYVLVGGSFYESKYTGGDGIERDTRFNGNYTFNSVYGKEWNKPSKNRSIGLSTRLLYLGGFRESEVDVTRSRERGETVYNTSDPFTHKLSDYLRLDLRLSFRKNKPGYTRTFAIDIQNLTSQQNEAFNYYDFSRAQVVTKYQLGIIPVLVYRIDF